MKKWPVEVGDVVRVKSSIHGNVCNFDYLVVGWSDYYQYFCVLARQNTVLHWVGSVVDEKVCGMYGLDRKYLGKEIFICDFENLASVELDVKDRVYHQSCLVCAVRS